MTSAQKKAKEKRELEAFKKQWRPALDKFFASAKGKRLVKKILKRIIANVQKKTGNKV